MIIKRTKCISIKLIISFEFNCSSICKDFSKAKCNMIREFHGKMFVMSVIFFHSCQQFFALFAERKIKKLCFKIYDRNFVFSHRTCGHLRFRNSSPDTPDTRCVTVCKWQTTRCCKVYTFIDYTTCKVKVIQPVLTQTFASWCSRVSYWHETKEIGPLRYASGNYLMAHCALFSSSFCKQNILCVHF